MTCDCWMPGTWEHWTSSAIKWISLWGRSKCVGIQARVHLSVKTQGQPLVLFFKYRPLRFFKAVFPWPRAHWFSSASWSGSSRDHPYLFRDHKHVPPWVALLREFWSLLIQRSPNQCSHCLCSTVVLLISHKLWALCHWSKISVSF